MLKPHQNNLNQLIIYQKSMDIFKLSRHIASYISYDKDILSMHKSLKKADKYASNLVMDALGLVPKIAETENQKNPKLKLKYAKSLRYFIDQLYDDCKQLEHTIIQGKDFLKLLRKELKKLREIHKHYVNSIL